MPDQKAWTRHDIPDLSGKTIVVTGGNSGIGYEAALEFARKRAKVILACRDLGKARTAAAEITASSPTADVEVMALDLSSLASIRGCADAFHMRHQALHVLCNNAGVMAIPYRLTADGFEMQFGTNHLGHFALTGLLLDRLLATEGARLVNLLFTLELQRRAAGAKLLSVACHPGYAATNLQAVGPRMQGSSLMEYLTGVGNKYLAQSAAMGALPTEYAAVAPEVSGADYIGPDGFAEQHGHPKKVGRSAAARDASSAKKLWDVSEQLTDVHYDALAR